MIIDVIKRLVEKQKPNHWYESYWAFDLHNTVIKPNHRRGIHKIEYYPYAKEVMQFLSSRADVRKILFTSSYLDEVHNYLTQFKRDGIYFDYLNENPEIKTFEDFGYYERKFYFDVLFEDKAGFDPETEWKMIWDWLQFTKLYQPDPKWTNPKRARVEVRWLQREYEHEENQ